MPRRTSGLDGFSDYRALASLIGSSSEMVVVGSAAAEVAGWPLVAAAAGVPRCVIGVSDGTGRADRPTLWSPRPRRNSLMLRPKDWAAPGRRLGPSRRSAMTRTKTSSSGSMLGTALRDEPRWMRGPALAGSMVLPPPWPSTSQARYASGVRYRGWRSPRRACRGP